MKYRCIRIQIGKSRQEFKNKQNRRRLGRPMSKAKTIFKLGADSAAGGAVNIQAFIEESVARSHYYFGSQILIGLI